MIMIMLLPTNSNALQKAKKTKSTARLRPSLARPTGVETVRHYARHKHRSVTFIMPETKREKTEMIETWCLELKGPASCRAPL
jgi:hypothetical protein